MIDSVHETSSSPTSVSVQSRLSRHLFTEFQLERQTFGSIQIGTLASIPSLWIQTEPSPDPGSSRRRIALHTIWPFGRLPIEKLIEIPFNSSHIDLDLGINQPLFYSESTLELLRAGHEFQLDIEVCVVD